MAYIIHGEDGELVVGIACETLADGGNTSWPVCTSGGLAAAGPTNVTR